jgi:hypothetical protein
MITALQLRERLNAVPFKPFIITMSDGRAFTVPNHDAMYVKRNSIIIGIDLDEQSLAEKYVECALLHITSIGDVPAGQPA